MDRIVIILILCAVGCAPLRNRGDEPEPGNQPLRLCVRNATVAYGNIVAHAGLVRFDVLPGQQLCRPVSDPGPGVALTAATTGGGSAGPLSFRNTLRSGASRCWTWTLRDNPGSALDLEPCREGSEDGTASGSPGR